MLKNQNLVNILKQTARGKNLGEAFDELETTLKLHRLTHEPRLQRLLSIVKTVYAWEEYAIEKAVERAERTNRRVNYCIAFIGWVKNTAYSVVLEIDFKYKKPFRITAKWLPKTQVCKEMRV